jgi:pyruvate-formate lyase-activating enzyme
MGILVSDDNGVVAELPGFSPLAQSGTSLCVPRPEEISEMPNGAHLYFLPNRTPLARKRGIKHAPGLAVSAILPQGYTRTLLPAYAPPFAQSWLPYFGYTAVFPKDGKLFVGAIPTQADSKWDPKSFPKEILQRKISARLKQAPKNRVLHQLAYCASEYHCYTAANIFFKRWEGALPVSPSCNAFCRGCISKAIDAGPPSPQDRLAFLPSLEECVQIAREHFMHAQEPILSFGQGCEGEPSLQASLIEKIIEAVKPDFPQGQFNLNTNGSRPKAIERLCKAGLDSIRVSLNCAYEPWYHAYYRPTNYAFKDVRETIRIAKAHGVFVSLNLLCFPGVTDYEKEMNAFFSFLSEVKPDMIQLRNLNIDPWCYLKECIQEEIKGIGMVKWLRQIKRTFPKIQIGNYTPYIKAR